MGEVFGRRPKPVPLGRTSDPTQRGGEFLVLEGETARNKGGGDLSAGRPGCVLEVGSKVGNGVEAVEMGPGLGGAR